MSQRLEVVSSVSPPPVWAALRNEALTAAKSEALARARAPFAEVLAAVMAGQILDVLTVAMVLKASHMAHEGSLPSALARAMMG